MSNIYFMNLYKDWPSLTALLEMYIYVSGLKSVVIRELEPMALQLSTNYSSLQNPQGRERAWFIIKL